MGYVWLSWLADALRAEGCRVAEDCGDWRHRGRPASTGAFNPYAVGWHHTAATASTADPFPSKSVLINGRSDLPGPLCHVGIGYDGVCHMIAAGRANHGGQSNGWGPLSGGDANAQLVGWEIDYNGTQPMSAAQKDAATRASAAVLKRFGRDESYAARHAEWSTTGKWDTGGVTGDQLRSMIRTQLEGEVDVPLTQDEINKIAKAVWDYGIADVDEAVRAARIVLKYVRSDTSHIRYVGPQDHWAFELADDVNQEKYQAQRLLRYTRNDAHAARDALESPGE